MSLPYITLKELKTLIPAIREQWHLEPLSICLAVVVRDCKRRGITPEITSLVTSLMIREWLACHLRKKYKAVAKSTYCDAVVVSLLEEVLP